MALNQGFQGLPFPSPPDLLDLPEPRMDKAGLVTNRSGQTLHLVPSRSPRNPLPIGACCKRLSRLTLTPAAGHRQIRCWTTVRKERRFLLLDHNSTSCYIDIVLFLHNLTTVSHEFKTSALSEKGLRASQDKHRAPQKSQGALACVCSAVWSGAIGCRHRRDEEGCRGQ